MFGLATGRNDDAEARRRAHVDRLTRALDGDSGVGAERGVLDEPSTTEAPPNLIQASTSSASPVPDPDDRGLREPSCSPADTGERKQEKPLNTNGMHIEQAIKSIADALVGTVASAAEDLRREMTGDRAKLEATADGNSRASQEIDQIKAALALLSPRLESLAQGEAERSSKLAILDDRFCREEELAQHTQERMTKLLITQEESNQRLQACTRSTSDLEARALASSEKLDTLSGGLQAQIDANGRLESLCAKLEARLTSQEQTIQALAAELRQRGGLVERLLGALRSLDLRRETRFPSDSAVKVIACGEQKVAVSGRIVNASENGLGLILEAPTPVGSKVRIEVDDTVLSGEIVRCHTQGGGYATGLRLAAPLPKE
jgi:hypothetical protein